MGASAALSQSLLLPAFVALFGVVAALFLRGFGDDRSARAEFDDGPDERQAFTTSRSAGAGYDHFPDDDEYVEYTIDWDEPYPPRRAVAAYDSYAEAQQWACLRALPSEPIASPFARFK